MKSLLSIILLHGLAVFLAFSFVRPYLSYGKNPWMDTLILDKLDGQILTGSQKHIKVRFRQTLFRPGENAIIEVSVNDTKGSKVLVAAIDRVTVIAQSVGIKEETLYEAPEVTSFDGTITESNVDTEVVKAQKLLNWKIPIDLAYGIVEITFRIEYTVATPTAPPRGFTYQRSFYYSNQTHEVFIPLKIRILTNKEESNARRSLRFVTLLHFSYLFGWAVTMGLIVLITRRYHWDVYSGPLERIFVVFDAVMVGFITLLILTRGANWIGGSSLANVAFIAGIIIGTGTATWYYLFIFPPDE